MKSLYAELENAQAEMFEAERKIDKARLNLVEAVASHYNIKNPVVGTWECENSPIDVCIYNHDKDPCHDYCLHCGGPDERK